MKEIKEALCFDDVLLVPQYFKGSSRKDIDLSVAAGRKRFDNPFVCANMSFCDEKMSLALAEQGALGILHRNNTPKDQVEMFERFVKHHEYGGGVGVAVGLTDWEKRLVPIIDSPHLKMVVLDVAHADQKKYWDTVSEIRNKWPEHLLCIGSFAHVPSQFEMRKHDKNLIWRTSIGGGSVCSTRIATGCGVPTLQAVMDLKAANPAGLIMADGGLKNSGDCVKSLAAGADFCMLGRVFAGCEEAHGAKFKDERTGKTYKSYFGNASAEGKRSSNNNVDYIEGVETTVEYSGKVHSVLRKLEEGVRSGMSYCGAMNIKELQEKAQFIKISPAGMNESKPHALNG